MEFLNDDKVISPGSLTEDAEFAPVYSDADLLDRAPFEFDDWDDDLKARYRTLVGALPT